MNYKYILLDTETVGKKPNDFNNQLIFDIGMLFLDEELNIVKTYQTVVKEIFDSEYMDNYVFDKERLSEYYQNLPKNSFEIIYKDLQSFFKDDTIIVAYNINFDYKAFLNTFTFFNKDPLIKEESLVDIYHMACQALKDNDNYSVFCIENEKTTPRGNLKTNAETVYSFIMNTPSFIESHTALEDCQIELEIFKWVKNLEAQLGIKYKTNPNTASWRLVQRRG